MTNSTHCLRHKVVQLRGRGHLLVKGTVREFHAEAIGISGYVQIIRSKILTLWSAMALGEVVREARYLISNCWLQAQKDVYCIRWFENRYGFHLVRLDAHVRREALPSFTAVLPRLREAQEKAGWVRAGRAYVEELTAKAVVTGIDLTETPKTEANIPA